MIADWNFVAATAAEDKRADTFDGDRPSGVLTGFLVGAAISVPMWIVIAKSLF